MAREDVNIKVSANVAEAIRLWKAMEEGPKAMGNELEAMSNKGAKSARTLNTELMNVAGQWVSIGAGIAAATKLLSAYVEMQSKLRDMEAGATRTADKAARELSNLAPSVPMKQIQGDLLDLATRRGVGVGQARDASAALLGAGYGYKDVMQQGGAGDAALRTLAATNATGKDVNAKELVDSLTGFLDATGQGKTAGNLAATGQTAQAMFASNKLEISDLAALAPRAKNIYEATGLKNEQIAIMSQFKDVTTADVGATAFHGAVNRLQGAGNNQSRTRALAQLGLKPEDVDFQGESFFDVQSRLSGALEKSGPNAGRIKNALFGEEAMLAANVLFTPAGVTQTQQRLADAKNTAGFNRAASITEGGLEAKAAAADAEEVKQFMAQGDFVDPVIARKQLMNRIKEAGGGAFSQTTGTMAYDTALGLGADANTAARTGMRWAGGSPEMAQQVIDASRATPVVDVRVSFTDQNQVAVPHKAEVHNVGKNKAPKE